MEAWRHTFVLYTNWQGKNNSEKSWRSGGTKKYIAQQIFYKEVELVLQLF